MVHCSIRCGSVLHPLQRSYSE